MKDKDIEIYQAIVDGYDTPTKIGLSLGYSYGQASSRVMANLKRLCKNGLIERKENPVRYQVLKG